MNTRMKNLLLFFTLILLVSPINTSGQETSNTSNNNSGSSLSIDLPKPISDFVDSLNNIKLDRNSIQLPDNLNAGEKLIGQNTFNESEISGWWNKLNTWLTQNIGISFSEILRTVGNFIVWAFELIVKLLKAGLSYLPV